MTKKSEAASTEVAEVEIDQDRIDRVIWRGIGVKTVRQIAEEAGVKPEEVLRRKGELLDSVDVLSIAEKRQRLVVDLQEIARKVRDDYDAAPFEFKAGIANSAVASMKVVLSELARAEKADTTKIETLNQKRVAELVNLMREVVDISVVEIAATHGLDEQELYDVFNRRMVDAAQKRDLA